MLDPNVGRPPVEEEQVSHEPQAEVADAAGGPAEDQSVGVGEWLGDAVANFDEVEPDKHVARGAFASAGGRDVKGVGV